MKRFGLLGCSNPIPTVLAFSFSFGEERDRIVMRPWL